MLEMFLKMFSDDESFPFFIQYGRHDEDVEIHTHSDFDELVIVLAGSAVHTVDDEEFEIRKGDVFVISNETSHGYSKVENFRICNIMYRPTAFFTPDSDITKIAGFHALFVLEPLMTRSQGFFCSRLKLWQNDFDVVQSIIRMMINEYEKKNDGWKTYLRSTFLMLSVMISRLYSFNESSEKNDFINLAQAVSYIESHFTEEISLDMLAEISHYSKRHFIRIFSKVYNSTPLEYIISLRINQACLMLRYGDATISEIAIQCGFGDSNYFSRVFKKRTGTSPRTYRENNPAEMMTTAITST